MRRPARIGRKVGLVAGALAVAAVALVTAPNLAAAAGGNQPDVIVSSPDGADRVGANVYNTTGAGQGLFNEGPSGSTSVYRVTVQNDGPTRASIRFRGCAGNAKFRVRYFQVTPSPLVPDVNVTDAVSGTGLVFSRDPGDTRTLSVVIKSKQGTADGENILCSLKAASGSGANRLVDVGLVRVFVGAGGK